jgi:tetratricopeptide (TPR) repeat protein
MDHCLEIAGSVAEQLDQPSMNWGVLFTRSQRAQIAGDIHRAEQLATEALEIGTESGQPDATLLFGSQLLAISAQRGNTGDLVPFIEQALADHPIPALKAGLALAHAEAGHFDAARRLLQEFAATDFDLPFDQVWITGMVACADAAIESHGEEYAAQLFDRLAPWADQLSCTGSTAEGPVSYYLGGLAAVLSRYDDANEYFEQSAAVSARMDAKFFLARTNLRWGKMLAKRDTVGDAERARDLIANAFDAAVDQGYGNVRRQAGEALDAMGLPYSSP